MPPPETHSGGLKSCFSYLNELYLAGYDNCLHLHQWGLNSFPLDGNFLTNITTLDLCSNGIRVVPALIASYDRLRTLLLDDNFFDQLPEQLSVLHNSLTSLSVSHNHLLKLPSKMYKLTALVTLNLAHNQLSSIPDSFSCLTMLRHLDLDFNKIPNIPASIGKLSRLQELLLEDNPIKDITPESLQGCMSMRNLRVTIDSLSELQLWRKDTGTYSLIHGHGVRMPPTEVVMRGPDCIFKYLQVVSSSRASKAISLSRLSFWMLQV